MSRKTLDIMMVFPAGGLVFFTHFKHHLGSAYIIGYLRQHGYTAEQFISNETYNVKECVKKTKLAIFLSIRFLIMKIKASHILIIHQCYN